MNYNWLDFALIVLLMVGMVVGYMQGVVRQLIGLAALYVGLVLATQFFQPVSRAFGEMVKAAPNTLTNALAFFALFFVVMSVVNLLALDAYKSTRIRLIPIVDHVVGMLLGLASAWVILTIMVQVLSFAANTQGWGGGAEGIRVLLKDGIASSVFVTVTASTLPMIVNSVKPWLPGGLPALFSL